MKKKIQAFTLIELMVVVVVIGILLALGIPGMRSFMINNELTSRNNNLVAALQYARSSSRKTGQRVTLCPSKTAMNAIPTCSGENDWLQGIIIFIDADGSSTFNPGDELLKQEAISVGENPLITITAEVLNKDEPVTLSTYVSFVGPRGEPQQITGNNQSGIFKICDLSDETKIRGIMLNPSGRISSSRDRDTLFPHLSCPSASGSSGASGPTGPTGPTGG